MRICGNEPKYCPGLPSGLLRWPTFARFAFEFEFDPLERVRDLMTCWSPSGNVLFRRCGFVCWCRWPTSIRPSGFSSAFIGIVCSGQMDFAFRLFCLLRSCRWRLSVRLAPLQEPLRLRASSSSEPVSTNPLAWYSTASGVRKRVAEEDLMNARFWLRRQAFGEFDRAWRRSPKSLPQPPRWPWPSRI